jgi:ribosomal protein S13
MEKGDFNHVIRIFNTNLPGGRTVLHSLIGIKGVGRRFGHAVIKRAGIDGSKRMGVLTAEEIEKLVQVPLFSGHHATTIVMRMMLVFFGLLLALLQVIERPLDYDIPAWMLNRRKDYTTGKDMHLNTNK